MTQNAKNKIVWNALALFTAACVIVIFFGGMVAYRCLSKCQVCTTEQLCSLSYSLVQ